MSSVTSWTIQLLPNNIGMCFCNNVPTSLSARPAAVLAQWTRQLFPLTFYYFGLLTSFQILPPSYYNILSFLLFSPFSFISSLFLLCHVLVVLKLLPNLSFNTVKYLSPKFSQFFTVCCNITWFHSFQIKCYRLKLLHKLLNNPVLGFLHCPFDGQVS